MQGQSLHRVIINQPIAFAHAVGHNVKPLAGHIDFGPVAEVPPKFQTHPQNRIPGIEQGQKHRPVGLRPRVWLDVGKTGAEEGLGPLDGQRFHAVHGVTAAVIALAWVAFGVFVGEHGSLRLNHRQRSHVF